MVTQSDPVSTFSSQVKRNISLSAYKAKYDDTGTYLYVGLAAPGTLPSESEWQIKRITAATGNIDWAGTSVSFNKEWDERTGYGYT